MALQSTPFRASPALCRPSTMQGKLGFVRFFPPLWVVVVVVVVVQLGPMLEGVRIAGFGYRYFSLLLLIISRFIAVRLF
jgi:hypothetical protein